MEQQHPGQHSVDNDLYCPDHELSEYGFNLRWATLQLKVKMYKFYSRRLLKVMGATQEQFDEYIKNNSTEKNNEALDLHYFDWERE